MILVTGATGFVGGSIVSTLLEKSGNKSVAAAVRAGGKNWQSGVVEHVIGDLNSSTDWSAALSGVTAVVHCAARVHVMNDSTTDPLAKFRHVNVGGTLNLARQAAAAGVRRFVYISSIKVNGERTQPDYPFSADDTPVLIDPYAISKYEAEQGLMSLASETGMEVVIIRPPLVYGPGVKANFLSMMRWLNKGIPLPFGAINNKRSLVALDNLVDLIIRCIEHPAAANEIFLVSDSEDLSTAELLQRTADALGKPARLLPVPQWLLTSGLKILGKSDLAQRLCSSLQVDIRMTRELLGWTPPVSVDEGLRKTAEVFLRESRR